PPYDWAPVASGKGLGWVSAPFARDMVIAGPSSLDLYLRSSARDSDLQVTLSEVRPDGNETYVQNGWLRASHRKLDRRRSTAIDPVPTHLRRDAASLPRGRFASVDRGRTRNTIALGGRLASRLVLPLLAGATAQGTPLPPPTALRGEPSRSYVAASNGG